MHSMRYIAVIAVSAMVGLGLVLGTGTRAQDEDAPAWTREQAQRMQLNETNTAPVIDPDGVTKVMPGYHLWDWWPVRLPDGNVAVIDGWRVFMGLTAPDNVIPGKRHDIAEYRYLVSRDGQNWTDGGPVFGDETEVLGSRQWAGSALYDPDANRITVFYTAAGEGGEQFPEDATVPPESGADETPTPAPTNTPSSGQGTPAAEGSPTTAGISYEQRIAMASADVVTSDQGVQFQNWSEHRIILQGDDQHYVNTAGTTGGAGNIDAFRDPWYFRHPDTGEHYLLFTASMPDDQAECDDFAGVVGIARAASDDLSSWELEPPLLTADCVNRELERPHLVVENGQYYMFFTSHSFTFDPALRDGEGDTPEGLFGLVADDLRGDYTPLNEGGLVLGNPPDNPFQAYSWLVLPNWWVTGFFQYFDVGDRNLTQIGQESPQYQVDHFGGTVAPSLYLHVEGDQTVLTSPNLLGPLTATDVGGQQGSSP